MPTGSLSLKLPLLCSGWGLVSCGLSRCRKTKSAPPFNVAVLLRMSLQRCCWYQTEPAAVCVEIERVT